jgi:hypothetical protein
MRKGPLARAVPLTLYLRFARVLPMSAWRLVSVTVTQVPADR